MAKNTDLTQLDPAQAVSRCVEASNDALRITADDFAIALDSSEDSIATVGQTTDSTVLVTSATPTGTLILLPCEGYSAFQIYSQTVTTVVGPQLLTLEVSPSDTGSFWVATTITLTPDAVAGITKMSTVGSFVAKRARITCATQISSGSFNLVLALRG